MSISSNYVVEAINYLPALVSEPRMNQKFEAIVTGASAK